MKCFSNITELLHRQELSDVLTQCGVDIEKKSDYELFRAFCEALPSLSGHILKAHAEQLLQAFFAGSLPLDAAHCDEIWHCTAEQLLQCGERPLVFPQAPFPKPLSDQALAEQIKSLHKTTEKQCFPCEGLIKTSATQWKAWESELYAAFSEALMRGDMLSFRLSEKLSFQKPDPYHVEKILGRKERSERGSELLLLQLLRSLFAFAKEREVPVLLFADCDQETAEKLFSYLSKTVGLPQLTVCTSQKETEAYFLRLSRKMPQIGLGVVQRGRCEQCFFERLRRLAPDYPIGKIQIIEA